MSHVFLTYLEEDADIAHQIRQILEGNNLEIWSVENLIGDNDPQAIEKALDDAHALVLIVSSDAKSSESIEKHLKYALRHNIQVFHIGVENIRQSSLQSAIQKLLRVLQIHEELRLLSKQIPTTYCIAVSTVDGLHVGSYVPKDSRIISAGEEDRMSSMSVVMLSLGERIVSELNAGKYGLGVFQGDRGTLFNIALGEKHMLTFGVREIKSIDGTLFLLKHFWGKIFDVLGIELPED